MDKRLASLSLSKDVLDRTPQEGIALILRLLVHKELHRLCHMAKEPQPSGEWNAFYARLMRLFVLSRDRKDEAGKLIQHLKRALDSPWGFLQESGVVAPNNRTGRFLRFPVIWNKCSFGTRTEQGEEFVERLLSFRHACRGKPTSPYFAEAFESYLSGKKPVAFFPDEREPCGSLNPARSLLSLSLKLSTFTVAQATLAVFCQGCFFVFSKHCDQRRLFQPQGV